MSIEDLQAEIDKLILARAEVRSLEGQELINSRIIELNKQILQVKNPKAFKLADTLWAKTRLNNAVEAESYQSY